MQVQKKSLPKSRVQLTITTTADQFRHAYEEELKSVTAGLAIPGFRKGKAPRAKVVERTGSARLESGALDRMITAAYYQAAKQEGLRPVEGPQVEVSKFEVPSETVPDSQEVATFTASVDVLPEIKLDGYQKLKIKQPAEPEVTEEDVEKIVDYLRKQKAVLKELPAEATLEKGMWADLTYEGSVGGVKRADMANQHHPLVIGEGQLIPGFEDQLPGMKVGEERTIEVTFPKEYHAAELAGKKAEFTVKLNELKEVILPEKDAAFAEQFGHSSYQELDAAIRESLQAEKRQEGRQQIEQEVLEELLKLAKPEVPNSLVEQELERLFADTQKRLDSMHFSWEGYLAQIKKTADQVREEMRPQAEKNVAIGLCLGQVMREEGIADSPDAGRQAVERLIEIATR